MMWSLYAPSITTETPTVTLSHWQLMCIGLVAGDVA